VILAKVLLDSISPEGYRLTTLEVVMPRMILAEFNTHRAFSRNSASSRAIPAAKMIERVASDPFIPVVWPRNQPGMQGGEEVDRPEVPALIWRDASLLMRVSAGGLSGLEVHKSLVNRLLEPFMWHTVIVTATSPDYDNFFAQRCSPLAEAHMEMTANAMRDAIQSSTPTLIEYGAWHTPLIQPSEDYEFWYDQFMPLQGKGILPLGTDGPLEVRKRVSTARCARVSYLTHDGKRSISADIELYDRLVSADPPHWSPLEHVATPARHDEWVKGNFNAGWDDDLGRPLPGGWHQMRHHT
jgi:hypothetical protein